MEIYIVVLYHKYQLRFDTVSIPKQNPEQSHTYHLCLPGLTSFLVTYQALCKLEPLCVRQTNTQSHSRDLTYRASQVTNFPNPTSQPQDIFFLKNTHTCTLFVLCSV